MKKQDMFWQTYLNIEKALIDISQYIYITDVIVVNGNGSEIEQSCNSQLETFSPYIADVLVQTCVQIEAISKELYYTIGGSKARGSSDLYFDEDCLKEIDKKWDTHAKTVLVTAPFFNLTKSENNTLRPLREAHKRQGTYWEKAYQAVKHDRYASIKRGNIKALLQAVAALYLLNIYYRNDSWMVSYSDVSSIDYSLGSAVFSVQSPSAELLWYGNNPTHNHSPYIVRYKEQYYKIIKDAQDAEKRAVREYVMSQPELADPEFVNQLLEVNKRDERCFAIWELEKYRLNKKIDASLPFEKKKELLINSTEWSAWVSRNNSIQPADIDPDNLQSVIDRVGTYAGIQVMSRYQTLSWVNDALNSKWCEVVIG